MIIRRACSAFAIAVALALPCDSAGDGCSIRRTAIDGVKHIIIENAYVRLTFVPSRGGACTSFVYKPMQLEWTTASRGGAMFEDHVWQQPYKGDWINAAYVPKILVNRPEEVALELSGQGSRGDYQFNTFKKTISLTSDSAAVRVRYSFEVGHDAMSAKRLGLWFHHSVAVPNQKIAYYYPLKGGVRRLLYDPSMPPEEYWEYEPTRGWIGAVAENGAGFACKMEYRRLMCLYQWFGQNLATFEWMFRRETIQNGASLETDILLHPFAGLKSVDGVGGGAVISLDVPASVDRPKALPLSATVALSGPARNGRIQWRWRRSPNLLWQEFRSEPVVAQAAKSLHFAADFRPSADGLYELQVRIVAGDEVLVEAEKPIVVARAKAAYAMLPKEKRIGNPDDRFGQFDYRKEDVELPLTLKVETPHVKWAKPYFKGKVKALFLMHCYNSREVVELAQRMDLDAPLIDFGDPVYVGDAYGKIRPPILNDMLKKYLKKDGYDVIVVSGLAFRRLDKTLPELLRRQVEKGVGLVYIAPWQRSLRDGDEHTASVLPFDLGTKPGPWRSGGKWQTDGDHFIARGVPVEALPQTGFFGYKNRALDPSAKVFMTVTRRNRTYPLGVLSGSGKQRTVVFTYRTSRTIAGLLDTLTPFIRFPKERFHYWEYHHSLLIRAMLWAARKEPTVRIEQSINPQTPAFGQTPVTIGIDVADAAQLGAAKLACTLRDKYWNVVNEKQYDLNPAAGRARASMTIVEPLPVGTYFVDCILRSQGKCVSWGTRSFQISGEERIASFALPQVVTILRTGDTAVGKAEMVNVKDGASLAATLSDNFGRTLGAKEYPIPASAKAQIDVSFPRRFRVLCGSNLGLDIADRS